MFKSLDILEHMEVVDRTVNMSELSTIKKAATVSC
jgi:hypothetical protein